MQLFFFFVTVLVAVVLRTGLRLHSARICILASKRCDVRTGNMKSQIWVVGEAPWSCGNSVVVFSMRGSDTIGPQLHGGRWQQLFNSAACAFLPQFAVIYIWPTFGCFPPVHAAEGSTGLINLEKVFLLLACKYNTFERCQINIPLACRFCVVAQRGDWQCTTCCCACLPPLTS